MTAGASGAGAQRARIALISLALYARAGSIPGRRNGRSTVSLW